MALPATTIWTYAGPFVAALMASAITYAFLRRAKRRELADAERLAAFRALHERLLSLARYCDAFAAEISGGDFDDRLDDLPESDHRSALMHRNDIYRTRQQWQYLLSAKANDALRDLDGQLGLICTMNLTATQEYLRSDGAAETYTSMSEHAMKCIDTLYEALELPK